MRKGGTLCYISCYKNIFMYFKQLISKETRSNLLSAYLSREGLSSQSPRTSIKPGGKATMSPSTPPPSPTPGEGEEETLRPDTTLVTITISTIDKKCPEFHSKYDGVSMIWCFVFLIDIIAVFNPSSF